jgi:hypothetical protein
MAAAAAASSFSFSLVSPLRASSSISAFAIWWRMCSTRLKSPFLLLTPPVSKVLLKVRMRLRAWAPAVSALMAGYTSDSPFGLAKAGCVVTTSRSLSLRTDGLSVMFSK